MSLDIYFYCESCGNPVSIDLNVTHNLSQMAYYADVYHVLWRPDEHAIDRAEQMIGPLEIGLEKLERNSAMFRRLDPPNGWGDYQQLLSFVYKVLKVARENPLALVRVWR